MKPESAPVLAVDATRMASDRTGIETYLHHVLPGVSAAWRAPADGLRPGVVKVFARDPAYASHVRPRPDVVVSAPRGWTQVALAPALRRVGADVYFSPIPILSLVRPMPCPAVITVHDFHDFRRRWWYFSRLLRRSFSIANGIICVSDATAHELGESFPEAAGKVTVVKEGADPAVFHDSREPGAPILGRLGLTEPPLLAVGTVQPRKNYDRLIGAYASLPAEGAPPLVIVGRPGWEFEETMALPAQLGVEDRVRFAGHLSENDVGELMRASVALCAVSTGEGFGLPLVEAMYSGLPILASDIPPFREVAGAAARFVNPLSEADIAAGMAAMLRDTAARAEMSAAGLGRRRLFSWDVAAAGIVGALRRALTSF